MAIRFRKSIKLLPGVRINLSKTGISTSIGPRGASLNLRGGKKRLTTSIPGTGFSQVHNLDSREPTSERQHSAWWLVLVVVLLLAFAVFR